MKPILAGCLILKWWAFFLSHLRCVCVYTCISVCVCVCGRDTHMTSIQLSVGFKLSFSLPHPSPLLSPLPPCLSPVLRTVRAAATRGRWCCYELSQGWFRQSPAEALFSGTISSMGSRKWVKCPASSGSQPYFSTSTSNRDQGFSLVMCLSSPAGGGRELARGVMRHERKIDGEMERRGKAEREG